MAAQRTTIELLPKEDWERGTFGKVLKWTLTVGRHIVIITELIVILAFLSRFKLDRDLTDLNENITGKQAIVEASASFESKYRFLQKRVNTIESLRKSQMQTDKIVDELSLYTPLDVYLSSFGVDGNTMTMRATALSEPGMATLINNLKHSTRYDKLVLSGIVGNDQKEIGISFQLKSNVINNN